MVNLSRREQQILALIGVGKTSREIAGSLSISVYTVNNHRKHICRKLDLHTTAALVAYAAGTVTPTSPPTFWAQHHVHGENECCYQCGAVGEGK